MGRIQYKVTLREEERKKLLEITKKGNHSSRKVIHALILLNADRGKYSDGFRTNESIAEYLQVGERMVDRIKKRFVEDSLESALEDKPSERAYKRKADGDLEARLIALSCSEAPEGFARWSLRMLADKMVELEYVESISHETIRRILKKTN